MKSSYRLKSFAQMLAIAAVCFVAGYAFATQSSEEWVEVFPKYKVYEYSERDVVCPEGDKPIHVMVGEATKEGFQEFYITCRELRPL